MVFAAGTHLIVISAGPLRETDRLIGELMKRLLDELRASQAMVNPKRLSTTFGNRSDSRVGLHLNSRIPTGTVRTEGGREPWSADVAGAGKASEQIVIVMLSEH